MSSDVFTFQPRLSIRQFLLCLAPTLEHTQLVALITLLNTFTRVFFVLSSSSSSSLPVHTRKLCLEFTDTRDIIVSYPGILRRLAFVRPASSIAIWTTSEPSGSLSLERGISRKQEHRSVSKAAKELCNNTSNEIDYLSNKNVSTIDDRNISNTNNNINNNNNNNNGAHSTECRLLDLKSLDLHEVSK